MLSRAIAFYQRSLVTRPLLTQSLSAGVIGIAGDGVAQFVIDGRSLHDYDAARGLRFFVLPAFYIAPILSQWFRVLDRVGGNARFLPLKRVLIDQIVFAPPFSASIIFNLHLLQGYNPRESYLKLREKFVDIYSKSVLFWPAVQLINFSIVPLRFRVIVVQLAALAWNAFLSIKTAQTKELPPLE